MSISITATYCPHYCAKFSKVSPQGYFCSPCAVLQHECFLMNFLSFNVDCCYFIIQSGGSKIAGDTVQQMSYTPTYIPCYTCMHLKVFPVMKSRAKYIHVLINPSMHRIITGLTFQCWFIYIFM